MKNYLLYYHTIRHLKISQLFYLVWYRLKWNHCNFKYSYNENINFNFDFKNWNLPDLSKYSKSAGNLSFTFLNRSHKFPESIDWNFLEHGKLWNYHLQYMEYLVDEKVPVGDRIAILIHISEKISTGTLPLESYPVSLRILNVMIFIHKHSVDHPTINKAIGIQLSFLENI